jgi:hypothetical protein
MNSPQCKSEPAPRAAAPLTGPPGTRRRSVPVVPPNLSAAARQALFRILCDRQASRGRKARARLLVAAAAQRPPVKIDRLARLAGLSEPVARKLLRDPETLLSRLVAVAPHDRFAIKGRKAARRRPRAGDGRSIPLALLLTGEPPLRAYHLPLLERRGIMLLRTLNPEILLDAAGRDGVRLVILENHRKIPLQSLLEKLRDIPCFPRPVLVVVQPKNRPAEMTPEGTLLLSAGLSSPEFERTLDALLEPSGGMQPESCKARQYAPLAVVLDAAQGANCSPRHDTGVSR